MSKPQHTCPECIRTFSFPPSKYGIAIQCPACDRPIKLPDDPEPATVEVVATLVSPPKPDWDSVTITTCDLNEAYQIIGPIYFQISNVGLFANKLRSLTNHYSAELAGRGEAEQVGLGHIVDMLFSGSAGHTDSERAFYISMLELRRIAFATGSDAVIGLNQDTDLDTNGFQNFYMQSYGTAVRRITAE